MYDVGCKGPSTFSPCPIVQWNDRTSWPIAAGHPCIGCTEKDFYDRFTPFYDTLPNIGVPGIESTSETIGLGLLGVATAGVAVHAGITAALRRKDEKALREVQPLEAFGDPVRSYRTENETTQGESH